MQAEPFRGEDPPGVVTDCDLLAASRIILGACIAAGLAAPDAEDVAQDVWRWLLESGNLPMIALVPWLGAVVQNYLRRYKTRRWRDSNRRTNSISPLQHSALSPSGSSASEAKLFLRRLATRLPLVDQRLLALMCTGYRLGEAARLLGIKHGSEQLHLGRIRILAMRLRRPGRNPQPVRG